MCDAFIAFGIAIIVMLFINELWQDHKKYKPRKTEPKYKNYKEYKDSQND